MKYIADLHIHSRFSRATSKSLNLPTLDYWAERKGLTVVGTGDLTHPEWLEEVETQLQPAEEGLYGLKPEFALAGGKTRFILSAEISSIYKKNGRVRKVHSLILFPNLEAARRLHERLDAIGNVRSDGRPILGLDVKDLLAICLDISPDIFFIPAHIWTPWFSLLGSKSGYDSVEECFEDLTPHIFALETGLSSDPPMNWRLSALDRYVLVSNSDAHSADKLGREANLFDTDLSYPAMIRAMQNRGGFGGTLEFFPEEGKYHLDGHRKCDLRLDPEETDKLGGLCPVCGKPVTVGVMNRVMELADRKTGFKPDSAYPFESLIPLGEVLGEILGCGPKTKKVAALYEKLLADFGSELSILRETSFSDLAWAGGDLLAEAIRRMRRGKVRAEGGYDGEYGTIKLFDAGEKEALCGQTALFKPGAAVKTRIKKQDGLAEKTKSPASEKVVPLHPHLTVLTKSDPLVDDLNEAQKEAVTAGPGAMTVVAGPGTGKTLVLTRRAAWLVREGLAKPEEILGITFTRQAAGELASRMAAMLPFRSSGRNFRVMTFHALGLDLLTEFTGQSPTVMTEEDQAREAKRAVKGTSIRGQDLLRRISLAKQGLEGPDDLEDSDFARAFGRYEEALAAGNLVDFDDLVGRPVIALQANPKWAAKVRKRFKWILVDEYQDVNHAQYSLTGLLTKGRNPNLTVIGDPDQAIYGFRGASAEYFTRFSQDFPKARAIRLQRNYRSSDTILTASGQVIAKNPDFGRSRLESGLKGATKVTIADLPTPAAEAEYIVSRIEKLLGGTSHFSFNSGRADGREFTSRDRELGLGDIAILYRLHALARPLADALDRAGLPYQQAGQEPVRETDGLDFQADKISLLTVHAAKGLEFGVVFLAGLEEGIMPYQPPEREPADLEEERRLFYVAMTRAKFRLYLTRSRNRTLFGKKRKPGPSPFLSEMDQSLKASDKLPDRPAKPKAEQLTLF